MKKKCYSDHLKQRIREENIPRGIPNRVFEEACQTFFDTQDNRLIKVAKIKYRRGGKKKDVAVPYDENNSGKIVLVTCFPLQREDKKSRIERDRWIPIGK